MNSFTNKISDYVVSEKLTLLMNNVFDVLNGRCIRNGITFADWGNKCVIIKDLLNILDKTEFLFDNLKMKETTRTWKQSMEQTMKQPKEQPMEQCNGVGDLFLNKFHCATPKTHAINLKI
jgi:hypothetical protein